MSKFNSSNHPDIESMWSDFKTNILSIMKKHVPTKTTSSNFNKPWITSTAKKAIRQKQRWYQKTKKSKSEKIRNKYREVKKMCQNVCRSAHHNYVQNLLSNDQNNKKLWAYIKSKNNENCEIADLQNKNMLIQDPTAKANLFNDHFCKVFSKPDPTPNPINNIQFNKNFIPKITVTRPGVLKLLSNLKEHKATGPDGIPSKLLKTCANEICCVLTLIFQTSLDQGTIPTDWKKANIVPVFKKDDKSLVQNYRPISLTSVTSKMLEHIVHSNIMTFLEQHSILDDNQHGFRKNRSCETQLITTLNDFSNCLNNKKQIDAVLLDFSKAFDKVDHVQLLSKLEKYGIRHSLLSWITSFLSSREQTVLVEGKSSSAAPVTSGVPQGTVLGPLLFLVYINDIASKLSPGTKIRLFADDSLLYRVINSPLDQHILQKDLDSLQHWELNNKMEFHPDKCNILRITNKINFLPFTYNIHNVFLKELKSAKYLGVIIDKTLSWNDHCSQMLKKANSTLAFIQRNLYNCPPNVKEACYKTLVRPKLEYGCSVWDPHQQNQIDSIEKIQKRAARFVTKNYTRTEGNTKKNMDFLGWPPLRERRAKTKLLLLYKSINGLIHIPIENLTFRSSNTRSKNLNLFIPQSSVNSHKYSFLPDSIRLWNSLPPYAKTSTSLSSFEGSLRNITVRCSY